MNYNKLNREGNGEKRTGEKRVTVSMSLFTPFCLERVS
jgi:hypothetical protein